MSGDPGDDEPSSGSGDEVNVINGRNRRTTPSSSGPTTRKRGRKACGDAMLEIAAASKMRAAALTKNEDRFSISKCIKALDDLQDSSTSSDDFDIELDEMELVATAAGYLYYHTRVNQPPTICTYLKNLLEGPVEDCRELLRMDKHLFYKLSGKLRGKGMLRDTPGVLVEEQVAIFLSIVGHNQRIRVIQERFRHSGETISRHFNNVLKAVKSLSREFLHPPPLETPSEIVSNKRLYPYFKDCIGVIDGMQIPAHLPPKHQSRFQNKKGILTQNVLAACTFDSQFIFVYLGWEGPVEDSRILRAVLNDPNQNFPQAPKGKYYLVDRDYTNTEGFIAPYPGTRYCLHEFRGTSQMPQNAHDLFNHRHMCLSNIIQRSFSMLKTRFPILKSAPQYPFHVQRDLVIGTCTLHNFIKREDGIHDWLFAAGAEVVDPVEEPCGQEPCGQELELLHLDSTPMELVADSLRDSIAFTMWDDFINKWEEW